MGLGTCSRALNGRCAAAGQGGPGAARGAAAADLAGETTQQLISFELELLGHAARGPGRALDERSSRSGWSVAADLPHRQASRWTPAFARCCVLTQRERAGLDTIINTSTGPPARSCVHPKYVSMSVLYGCVWVVSFVCPRGRTRPPKLEI